jgi:hypothetical protein
VISEPAVALGRRGRTRGGRCRAPRALRGDDARGACSAGEEGRSGRERRSGALLHADYHGAASLSASSTARRAPANFASARAYASDRA